MQSEKTKIQQENEENKKLLLEHASKSTSQAKKQKEKNDKMVTEIQNVKEEYVSLKKKEDNIKHKNAEVENMHSSMVETLKKSTSFEINVKLLEEMIRVTDKRCREEMTQNEAKYGQHKQKVPRFERIYARQS